MSGFLNNLLNRYRGEGINIEPRIKGRYETDRSVFHTSNLSMQQDQRLITRPEYISSRIPDEMQPGKKTVLPQNVIDNQSPEHGKLNTPEITAEKPRKTESKKKASAETSEKKTINFSGSEKNESSKNNETFSQSGDEYPLPDFKITRKRVIIKPDNVKAIKPIQESPPGGSFVPGKKTSDLFYYIKEDNFTKPGVIEPWITKPEKKETEVRQQIFEKANADQPGQLIPPPTTKTEIFQRHSDSGARGKNSTNGSTPSAEDITIKVSIGRIEIKTVNQQPSKNHVRRSPAPIMTLDEYLNKQSNNWK